MYHHNGKPTVLHRVRDDDCYESAAPHNPDATWISIPTARGPAACLVLAVFAQCQEDIDAFVRRRTAFKGRENHRREKIRNVTYDAWIADQWLHGFDGVEMFTRLTAAECFAYLGVDGPDWLERMYRQWPNEQIAVLRSAASLEVVRKKCEHRHDHCEDEPSVVPKVRKPPATIRWDQWLSKDRNELVKGVDFDNSARRVCQSAYKAAKHRGLTISAEHTEDMVIIHVMKRGE